MDSSNLVGRTIGGRYQIDSLIGRGGMATVYKARDPNLRRTVAIKVIHTHLSNNPDFLRRFEEEAAAVAQLRHPNIVQVYDFNHENDLYYMVMEFIQGETLQTRLKRLKETGQRFPTQSAVATASDICSAAEEAHRHGLIHRDIKPANVMLAENGNSILMDFGVARILGGAYRTVTGSVLGTAMYMSPEQIQGYHVDARADIYSIGVVLYEMLGGRPPYEADSAMTVMMMHLNDPIPDIRKLQPGTPQAIVELIDRALAKKPELRYPSAGEMGNALKQAAISLEQKAAQPVDRRTPPVVPFVTIMESADQTLMEPQTGSTGSTLPHLPPAPLKAKPSAVPNQGNSRKYSSATMIEPARPAQPPSRHRKYSSAPASAPAEALPAAVQSKNRIGVIFFLLAAVLILVVLGGFGYLSNRAYFDSLAAGMVSRFSSTAPSIAAVVPDSPTNTATSEPLVVIVEPAATETPSPTQTSPAMDASPTMDTPVPEVTPTPTRAPVVIGGADKIAYLDGSNIWMANLDGSELTQLTSDGATKSYLRWLPDGQGLIYISGKCLKKVSVTAFDETITCFPNSDYLDSFEISPDGTQAVISLDNLLYLIPFDLEKLKEADRHSDLAGMATCPDLAPYLRNFASMVRWSDDGTRWAALILGVLEDGRRGSIVQVFPIDRCIPNPMLEIHFPPPHFTFKEYIRNPVLESIAWDGDALFSFHDSVRNQGFGNLHVFNMETYRDYLYINPIDNVCCYRDVDWSPDGSYLLFAFQNYLRGSSSTTQLYYIPYGSIGTGAKYEPLPLPVITNPREKPQPVLRPALSP